MRQYHAQYLDIAAIVVTAVVLIFATGSVHAAQSPQRTPPVGTPTSRIHRTVIQPTGGRVNRYRWQACLDNPADCPTVVAATPTPRPRRR